MGLLRLCGGSWMEVSYQSTRQCIEGHLRTHDNTMLMLVNGYARQYVTRWTHVVSPVFGPRRRRTASHCQRQSPASRHDQGAIARRRRHGESEACLDAAEHDGSQPMGAMQVRSV